MNSNFVIKLALSTAFVAVSTLAASNAGIGSTQKVSAKKAGPEKAYGWAKKAEKALAKGKSDRALTYAELAVEADMENRDYRSLLARVYLAQGRFVAAERTLVDVMELGQVDPRTVISLALTRIAQGNVDSAVALVDANRAIVPVSDYGLTLALAGRAADAVSILSEAVRTDNATARTRQNLALAYALNGRWSDARVMASQDMAQDNVNERIAEWAQFARPNSYTYRVASLLNVRPNMSDGGQPTRLALNTPTVPASLAQSASLDLPFDSAAPQPVVELAAIGEVPVAESAGFAAVETEVKIAEVAPAELPAFEAPLIKAQIGPSKSTSGPVKLALAQVPAPKSTSIAGSHLVQLGAFSSVANAEAAWSKYSKRYNVLQGFGSASSTVTVNGKKLVRLAAMGFGNSQTANAACKQIKSQGGVCLVRNIGGVSPVRMASGHGRRIAAR
ncbi:MAG: tetratricopeptide repeat protein [Sphingorhabdus sp.]